jgi:GDP-L-fucose synthase
LTTLTSRDRILVTGGTGLIGTNLCERLRSHGLEVLGTGSAQDLRQAPVAEQLFASFKPTVVFHLAARVGGIYANSHYKAGFYTDNVLINTHVVDACVRHGVKYVFAMGTGCAYPKRLERETLHEDDFLDGIPEVTNDAYAYAKRGLLVHLQSLHESGVLDYMYCLPANIYGPHDNFHPMHSHVAPGLIRRFCDAVDKNQPAVAIWGDGTARRDFLYIDDLIDAIELLVEKDVHGTVNVATGELTSIRTLAETIRSVTGFAGDVTYDTAQPAGQMQRIFDRSKIAALGWSPQTTLMQGMRKSVDWFRASSGTYRER